MDNPPSVAAGRWLSMTVVRVRLLMTADCVAADRPAVGATQLPMSSHAELRCGLCCLRLGLEAAKLSEAAAAAAPPSDAAERDAAVGSV